MSKNELIESIMFKINQVNKLSEEQNNTFKTILNDENINLEDLNNGIFHKDDSAIYSSICSIIATYYTLGLNIQKDEPKKRKYRSMKYQKKNEVKELLEKEGLSFDDPILATYFPWLTDTGYDEIINSNNKIVAFNRILSHIASNFLTKEEIIASIENSLEYTNNSSLISLVSQLTNEELINIFALSNSQNRAKKILSISKKNNSNQYDKMLYNTYLIKISDITKMLEKIIKTNLMIANNDNLDEYTINLASKRIDFARKILQKFNVLIEAKLKAAKNNPDYESNKEIYEQICRDIDESLAIFEGIEKTPDINDKLRELRRRKGIIEAEQSQIIDSQYNGDIKNGKKNISDLLDKTNKSYAVSDKVTQLIKKRQRIIDTLNSLSTNINYYQYQLAVCTNYRKQRSTIRTLKSDIRSLKINELKVKIIDKKIALYNGVNKIQTYSENRSYSYNAKG